MFSKLTLVTLVLTSLHSLLVKAAAPIGCVDLRLAPAGGLTVPTPGGAANCDTACSGYDFFYWQQAGDYCYCLNTSGDTSMYVFNGGVDSAGTCRSDLAAAFKRRTTFGITGCYSSITPIGRQEEVPIKNAESCFSGCARYYYASFTRSSGTYTCLCFDDATYGSTANCGVTEFTRFTYYHNADARASGLARRRRLENQFKLEASLNQACPKGLKECPVPGHPGAYECVDWKNDLESCGGCTTSNDTASLSPLGVNCMAIPGVSRTGTTCDAGRCVVLHCRPGWKLRDGKCEPKNLVVRGRVL